MNGWVLVCPYLRPNTLYSSDGRIIINIFYSILEVFVNIIITNTTALIILFCGPLLLSRNAWYMLHADPTTKYVIIDCCYDDVSLTVYYFSSSSLRVL